MFGLIGLGIATGLGVVSHLKSRSFVQKRLRFTKVVEKPAIGLVAGLAATFVAAPIVAVLPFVGAATAIAIGAGVGTGVHLGAKDSDRPLIGD